MNNIKIKTTNKTTLITVVLNFYHSEFLLFNYASEDGLRLEIGFRKKRNYTVYEAKTKALISFADRTVKLICAYVLAYARNRFSYAAQLSINLLTNGRHTS